MRLEIHAIDQLHDEVRRRVLPAEVVDAHDVAVVDLRHGPRLGHEVALERGTPGRFGTDQLDRDVTLELLVAAEQDHAHRAAAELSHHAVLVADQSPHLGDGHSDRQCVARPPCGPSGACVRHSALS